MIPKLIRVMLNKFLSFSTRYDLQDNPNQDTEEHEALLPGDVKKGQFAVLTVDDGILRRSVMELIYLTHPGFLKLLELAEEEFGFEQMGVLVIPCTYSHLQSVTGRR